LKIAVLKDADAKQGDNSEARVSATPDTVKGYAASGHDVAVVKGAGTAANFSDADYKAAGASIATTNATAAKTADLVMSITGRDAKFVAGGGLCQGRRDRFCIGIYSAYFARAEYGYSLVAI